MKYLYVKNKGKTYRITKPTTFEDGIGAGCPSGTAWLQDGTGSWYSVQLTGLSGSLSYSITAIPAASQSVGMNANDFGFQLVQANDSQNYQVYITAGPTLTISQSIAPYNSSKPYLFLRSLTDDAYYYVSANNSASVITLVINSNTRVAGSLVQALN